VILISNLVRVTLFWINLDQVDYSQKNGKQLYHISADELTMGRMITSRSDSPPVEVST